MKRPWCWSLCWPWPPPTCPALTPGGGGDAEPAPEALASIGSGEPVRLIYAAAEVPDLAEVEPLPTPEPAEVLDEHEPNLQISEDFVNPEPVKTFLGRYYVTGYDICLECCGKLDGITASGAVAQVGRTVAAPEDIPFGTVLYIDGIGERVVEDRGGLVTGDKLDVLCTDHPACYAITGWYDVYIVGGQE